MAPNETNDRLDRVEESLYRFREDMHREHLELISKIQDLHNTYSVELNAAKENYTSELNKVAKVVERHSGYWATLLGFSSFIGAGLVAWIQGIFPGKH